MLHGDPELLLATQELFLSEAAHVGVGAAEAVRLVEELRKADQCLRDLFKRVAAESCGGERLASLVDSGISVDRPGGLAKELPREGAHGIEAARKPLADQHGSAWTKDAADLARGSFEVRDVVEDERQPCAVRRVICQREGVGVSVEYLNARAARDLGPHCRRRLDGEDSEVETVAERGGERAGPSPDVHDAHALR